MQLLKKIEKKLRIFIVLITGFGSVFFPFSIYACAVCITNSEEVKGAFYTSILFMAILPPLLVASLAYWIYRKKKSQKEELNEIVSIDEKLD